MLEPHWRELLSGNTEMRKGHPNTQESASPVEDLGRWLGFPPATDEQIVATEQRLGITLPCDLKSFYRVTNGWSVIGVYGFGIVPVNELAWLSEADPVLCSNCMVDQDAPINEVEREWWYEQGIKVCRSILLSTGGSEARLLFDPATDTTTELRYGLWASWIPAMEWSDTCFAEFFAREQVKFRKTQ